MTLNTSEFLPRALAVSALCCAMTGAAASAAQPAASAVSAQTVAVARPLPAQLKGTWEGGTWTATQFSGGGWFSGYKTGEEYLNLDFMPPNAMPLNAEYLKTYRNIRTELKNGRSIFDPDAECHPAGLPYIFAMDGYGGFEVVVGLDELVILHGGEMSYRHIYLDGRAHPDERSTPPSYYGHSVGHFEGRTLVIDTRNLRGNNTQIEPHMPKAEGAHLVERYTPVSDGLMDAQFTLEIPAEFTRPWVVKYQLKRKAGGQLKEGLCTDGNRYGKDASGEITMHAPDGKTLEKAEE